MVNRAKKQSRESGKEFLRERFVDVETEFRDTLVRQQKAITHDGTRGEAAEDAWILLMRQYLPSRYRVARAFAVDHLGNTTDQLDCIIYDAHFTPTLFGKDNHQYIPAEAIYATFEIKPQVTTPYLKAASRKAESLRILKRTSAPLEGAFGVNPAKEPFHIIGGILAIDASWRDGLGRTFGQNISYLKGDQRLDLVLTAKNGLWDGLEPTGEAEVVEGEGSLLRGLFRLLKALRAKASVTAVDWDKYEGVFEK